MSRPEASGPDRETVRESAHGADPARADRWLSIVGIGEDGIEGLGATARQAIATAEIVFGGRRHLALAAPLVGARGRSWPSPFDAFMREVTAARGRRVCVLASGDPFFFGVGATLARVLDPAEFDVHPAPSSFSLAAARLGWAIQDVDLVSLHGRPVDLLRRHLAAGRRIIALTTDGACPARIAAILTQTGFGASEFTVLEALGGPRERIRRWRADAVPPGDADPLNMVAIRLAGAPDAQAAPLGFGIADDRFEHDGQITKREIRAVTLSSLAPRPGALLWDIGAGSGSIAIEWLLAHPSLAAIAVESDPERAARIGRNAARFGVPQLAIVAGRAPAALAALPAPDAVFIGGGARTEGTIDIARAALKPGGRLVANAVTLETEALLVDRHRRHGGDLLRLEVARAGAIGTLTGWRPALPVVQWLWVKPW